MITVNSLPNTYKAGNSSVPLQVRTTDNYLNHRCNLNFIEREYTPISLTSVAIGLNLFTEVEFDNNHDLLEGDVILVLDSVYPKYNKHYQVVRVINSTTIVINLTQEEIALPIDWTVYKSKQFIAPFITNDLIKNADFELHKYTKSLFKSNYKVSYQDSPFDASNTRYKSKFIVGESYTYQLEFIDNVFTTGSLGLLIENTQVNDIQFNVGDSIVVQIDLHEWNTTGIDSDNGNLQLISATEESNYQVGQTVFLTEQTIANGPRTIIDVQDSTAPYTITVNYPYTGSPTTVTGKAFANAEPGYQGVATILDIIQDGQDVIIKTNKIWTNNTRPLKGTVQFANDTKLNTFDDIITDEINLYDAHFEYKDFSQSDMNDYVSFTPPIPNNFERFSTIYKQDQSNISTTSDKYFINKSDKASILLHSGEDLQNFTPTIECYDENYNQIFSASYTSASLTGLEDVYLPIGLQELVDNSALVDNLSQSIVDETKYYTLSLGYNIHFETLCYKSSNYLSLIFKDDLSSFISLPVNLVNRLNIETNKNKYYQKSMNFDNSTETPTYINSGGERIYNNIYRYKYILNTDLLDDLNVEVLKSLMKSDEIYLQEDGELIRVNLLNNDKELKQQLIDGVYSYTLQVEYANIETK